MRWFIFLAVVFSFGCEWKPKNACDSLVASCITRCAASVATADLAPCYRSCAQSYVICQQGDNLCVCSEREESNADASYR